MMDIKRYALSGLCAAIMFASVLGLFLLRADYWRVMSGVTGLSAMVLFFAFSDHTPLEDEPKSSDTWHLITPTTPYDYILVAHFRDDRPVPDWVAALTYNGNPYGFTHWMQIPGRRI